MSGASPIRIVLIDDHALVRYGLAQVLNDEADFTVCGEAAGRSDGFRIISETRPDVAVIDITLEDGNGFELMDDVRKLSPEVKMLVVSRHDEKLFAARALEAGAMGYVNKRAAIERLVDAIRSVAAGEVYVTSEMSERFFGKGNGNSTDIPALAVERLSAREFEIFELLGAGLSVAEIAGRLSRSVKTINVHRDNIRAKLGLDSAHELLRQAVAWSLRD